MIAAAIISCAVAAIVLSLAFLVQSERAHERSERERRRKAIADAEKDLEDALHSHNLARIANARANLQRLRGE